MIKTHEGCPICNTSHYTGSGSTSDPKCYYTCENGHKWAEYTSIEIIDDEWKTDKSKKQNKYKKEIRTNNEKFMISLFECFDYLDYYDFMNKRWEVVDKYITRFVNDRGYFEQYPILRDCIHLYYIDDPDSVR